jgi:hypothetical protein
VEATIDATSAPLAITGGPAIVSRCAFATAPIRLGRQMLGGKTSETDATADQSVCATANQRVEAEALDGPIDGLDRQP